PRPGGANAIAGGARSDVPQEIQRKRQQVEAGTRRGHLGGLPPLQLRRHRDGKASILSDGRRSEGARSDSLPVVPPLAEKGWPVENLARVELRPQECELNP